jgi:hypothetical protein
MGAQSSATDNDSVGNFTGYQWWLGGEGGEIKHTLTTNELPADVPHNTSFASGPGGGRQAAVAGGSGHIVPRVDTATGAWQSGGGTGHNVIQPYQNVHWMIKT